MAVAFKMRKFKLIFADSSTEMVETIGLGLAWFKGKLRAAEKGTLLFKVEEVQEKKFRVRYIDLETGKPVERTISEVEQYDLYKAQREGKISIISIETVKSEIMTFTALEKESAKAQLSTYINSLLSEYTAKTMGVDIPPAWAWTLHWPIFYSPRDKTIYITESVYVLGYICDPYKTERALRWAVAHEFHHYVQDVRGEWVIRVPILSFPRVAEYIADKKAVLLSGVSDPEGMALTREIMELVLKEEGEIESS